MTANFVQANGNAAQQVITGGSVSADLDDVFLSNQYLLDRLVGSTLYGWGDNGSGSVGVGSTTPTGYSSPVQVGAINTWAQVATASYDVAAASVIAIRGDGTLWAWGTNAYGQLGNNNTVYYSSPIQVGTLTDWKSVVVSGGSTPVGTALAIKNNYSLWAWGNNNAGQIGNGNRTNLSSPVQIGTLTNWRSVAVSQTTSLAIKLDGTLWGWGDNGSGTIGDSTTVNKSSPVQVGTLTNWQSIAGAGFSSYAIKKDGTLWAWGSNIYGQLGIPGGLTTTYSSPTQIGSLTNWASIAAGSTNITGNFVVAIKTDGTLWAWGANNVGQLGINNTTNYSSPIQVGTLTNWKYVVANAGSGSGAVLAIKTDGTLWAWGNNGSGQLGLGNTTNRSSPVQVGTLSNWRIVSLSQTSFGIAYNT